MKKSALRQKVSLPQGFTLIELLVVIAIIGVLASLVVGLAGLAGRKSKEARVRAELAQYVTAIERFKDRFGYYPPDHLVSSPGTPARVDPVINQLYYELSGVVITNGGFQISQGILPSIQVMQVFGREGFVNAAADRKELKSFVGNWKASQVKTVRLGSPTGSEVQLLGVPVDYPNSYAGIRPNVFPKQVNPWRYVSTNPTNNPNSFDLWAEVPLGRETKIIGNWKE